jgi:hypothetical protein
MELNPISARYYVSNSKVVDSSNLYALSLNICLEFCVLFTLINHSVMYENVALDFTWPCGAIEDDIGGVV